MSSFTESLIVSPIPDGKRWVVRKEFYYYIDKDEGEKIIVPTGFVTDFASVPRMFWKIFPQWGKYGNAAVVHDYLYVNQTKKRKDADKIFLKAMEVSGVSLIVRNILYGAVRAFGWLSFKRKGSSKNYPKVEPLSNFISINDMNLKVYEGF